MKQRLIFIGTILCLSWLIVLGCNEDELPPINIQLDEIVFFNGDIYTVDATQEWVDAVYVKSGVIEFMGSEEEARNQASESATFIDLQGAFMMPGIHDVHMHPLEAASDNFQFIVNENENDPENYAFDVETAMETNPGDGWLLGWGHYLETILAAERPPKDILDEVAPNRPVAIMEQTSHSIWCNSKALEIIGFTANSNNPIGGIIMRTAAGEPNGILIDNAGNMLLNLALSPTPERAANDYNGLVEYALPELAKNGITSICDARTYWKRNHHEIWQRLVDENQLTVRVNLGLWAYPSETDATQIETLKSLYQYDPNGLLQINQIKLYGDGIIHNTTAAMHDDYLVDYFGQMPNNGLNYFTQDRIALYISELENTGFDLHIHAIGNRGVTEALNAIEQSGTNNGRHRLTHVEFVDVADYPRFAQLNVTADAQVAGDFTQPEEWENNDPLIGATLADNIIPLASLQDAGARITLSSDWDVSDLNPFIGLENAVRRDPQALSLADAIKAYTLNAAYVMRQEDRIGSIEVGKKADFIVLDRNLFDISPSQISNTKVLETWLDGALIYQR